MSTTEERPEEKRLGDPLTQRERFDRTLFATVDALDEKQIPYAMIGGVAVRGLGRPRITHDVDIFLRPDDAERALEALAAHGFRTQRTDPHWLYKAWREEILVDIVFKSTGDIYFDEELQNRSRAVQYKDRDLQAVSAEDFVVIKSAVHREDGPHHWYDALAVLTHGNIDWEYLLKRARHAPRRVLALLVYAQSNDIQVPNWVVRRLFETLYREDEARTHPPKLVRLEPGPAREEPDVYVAGRVRAALAHDERTGDTDVKVYAGDHTVTVRGEVATAEQARAVEEVARRTVPGWRVESHISVRDLRGPEGVEAVV